MGRGLALVSVLALGVVGCGKIDAPEAPPAPGATSAPAAPDKVVQVSAEDARMNAAITKARSTVDTFINALKAHRPDQTDFAVKAAFTDGDKTEHMWIGSVSFDGTNFRGTVQNEPEMVKSVKEGQEVTVAPAQISDWMYAEKKKLVGGQTVRAVRDGLAPAERAEFDKNLPYEID
jgi:uncharacterized protein YegJ (DUF2314 family)